MAIGLVGFTADCRPCDQWNATHGYSLPDWPAFFRMEKEVLRRLELEYYGRGLPTHGLAIEPEPYDHRHVRVHAADGSQFVATIHTEPPRYPYVRSDFG